MRACVCAFMGSVVLESVASAHGRPHVVRRGEGGRGAGARVHVETQRLCDAQACDGAAARVNLHASVLLISAVLALLPRAADAAVPPGVTVVAGTLTSCAGFSGTSLDLGSSALTALAPGAFSGCPQVTSLCVAPAAARVRVRIKFRKYLTTSPFPSTGP